MRVQEEDTPPSSQNGDEITGMEDDLYFEEVEEIQMDDEELNELTEQDYEYMDPPEDHSALVFSKHVGSVFCCDLHPDGKMAVTGGEDDKAYVWSVETGEVIMDCTGHKDSVILVGFSFDGVYLATGDMAGLLKVWKVNTENQEPWSVVFEYEMDDLSWGQWHFGAKVLVCGVITGDIYLFKIPSGDIKVLQGHSVKTECGKISNDGVRLAAGYEDGSVKVWDLKTSTSVILVNPNTFQRRVTAVDIHPENNLVCSIFSDGKVVFSTPNNGKLVGQQQTEDELETVAFSKEPIGYVAFGTLTGAVSIWDVARQMRRHTCEEENEESQGVTQMLWIKDHLVTGCLDGSVRMYESKTGQKKATLTGHRSAILDICYNAKQNVILTTSDDNTARIFKYEINNEND